MDLKRAEERARWLLGDGWKAAGDETAMAKPSPEQVNLAECFLALLEERDSSLGELCRVSAEVASKSGFSGQTLPEFVALCHSELSEALEEHRAGRRPDEVHYSRHMPELEAAIKSLCDLHPEEPLPKGYSARVACRKDDPGAKPEGIPSELADVVIRCCHYAGANRVDLAAAVREKTAYNKTRPFKHGGKVL